MESNYTEVWRFGRYTMPCSGKWWKRTTGESCGTNHLSEILPSAVSLSIKIFSENICSGYEPLVSKIPGRWIATMSSLNDVSGIRFRTMASQISETCWSNSNGFSTYSITLDKSPISNFRLVGISLQKVTPGVLLSCAGIDSHCDSVSTTTQAQVMLGKNLLNKYWVLLIRYNLLRIN